MLGTTHLADYPRQLSGATAHFWIKPLDPVLLNGVRQNTLKTGLTSWPTSAADIH